MVGNNFFSIYRIYSKKKFFGLGVLVVYNSTYKGKFNISVKDNFYNKKHVHNNVYVYYGVCQMVQGN